MDRDEESEKWRKVKERERWITIMREWADIRGAFVAADWLKPSLIIIPFFFHEYLFLLFIHFTSGHTWQPFNKTPPKKVILCFLNAIYLKAALIKSPI